MNIKNVITAASITLGEDRKRSKVTVTRAGEFRDHRYGEFSITLDMLNKMVSNFNDNTYGQEISIDVAHNPSNGAAGKIVSLSVEGKLLQAVVEWTEYGVSAIKDKGFNYLSAEYSENFVDNEAGNEHGCLLIGAGLTVRPVIKNLDKVELSTPDGADIKSALEVGFLNKLKKEGNSMDKYLKKLSALDTFKKLAEAVRDQLKVAFKDATKTLSADKDLGAIYTTFEKTVKVLSDNIGETVVKLDLGAIEITDDKDKGKDKGKETKTLSEDDIAKVITKQLAEIQANASKKEEDAKSSLKANIKTFSETISETEGANDETVKLLSESYGEVITANMGHNEVVKLAQVALSTFNKSEADKKLSAMGWSTTGSPAVRSVEAMTLQESIDNMLGKTSKGRTFTLSTTEVGKKQLEAHPFIDQVLAAFDARNKVGLQSETRVLAEGQVGMTNTDLPVGFQRTVIREALADLKILMLVNTLVDSTATTTTQVPYELRGTVGGIGKVFEGQGIPNAGITQKMDMAFLEPIKLALQVSDEVMHFTKASQINWDAYARNVASNARIVREIVARKITNEIIRASDAYGAVTVTTENVSSQLTGAVSSVKTAKYPVVQPKQVYTLQGDTVGNASNPITITLGGNAISEYDPDKKNQATGTYWVLTSSNLGYISFVNKDGDPENIGSSVAVLITYDRATNFRLFDINVPSGVSTEEHYNGLLRAVGGRKAYLSATHFMEPEFMLMSPVLNDMITTAKEYTANSLRRGTSLGIDGDLETIKGLPALSTNTPGTQLADTRLLMGPQGITTYTIAKAFMTGVPVESVDSEGSLTGQKIAYGTEFSSIHTPSPIAKYYTSVIAVNTATR